MLGPVEVRAGDDILALGGTRSECILAALLLDAGRVVSIGRLVGAAWGDDPPGSARIQVQNRVGSLRRLLRGAQPDGTLIATKGSGYLLLLGDWEFDLNRFDQEIARADALEGAGSLVEASRALSSALSLWRGSALDGLSTPLLQAAAVHLEERRLNTLERRVQLDLDLGRHRELVPELTNLTGAHPYQEGLHALLMLALHRSGRQTEALHAYHRVRQLLDEQIGVAPGERLRTLHESLVRGDDGPSLVPPAGALPPVTVRAAAVPRELPADVAGFTGRRSAIEELDTLLSDDAQPATPVVISGTAGVGKTALAVHWAHRAAGRFPDGQLYLNLRGYAPTPPVRPAEALGVLLRSLGVRPERVPTDGEEAASAYRSLLAGRRMLVVLDNARSAEQVRPLLPGSPGCLVLITSRDRLAGLAARDGAHRIALDILTPDEAETLLTRLLGQRRVRDEPQAAAELAELCAHLPLALRIAVANLTQRPYRRIADLLTGLRAGNRLAALTADDDEETAVQVALDRSYATVSPAAQRLFRLLSLLPDGDFSAAAAAVLADICLTEAYPLLDRLAGAHLIEECGKDRFTFHGLLRQYAWDRALAQHAAPEGALTLN
ncbi:hypothetical protein C1I93_07920 [Micromonospora endophytica]|uniref:OmpR/PhoB-type domain-containing protein n=1 Tax=Micromonospora endophytica TaxID=515350 RepID=A0A2W2E1E2_9ACTN|nr:hypothetical protein C1I93_07920 [Micromonospora endophytica]RIW43410.1 hypothetical protein D3H59_20765 [Micromonospora endophytica]